MVRATVIVSALFALASTVYAKGTLVNVDGGHHIGVNNLNLQGLGQEAVDARGTAVRDLVQNVDVLDGDDDEYFVPASNGGRRPNRISRPEVHEHTHDCHHDDHHGLLGHLLKREEAPAVEAADAVQPAAIRRNGAKNMRRKNIRKHMMKKNARARRH